MEQKKKTKQDYFRTKNYPIKFSKAEGDEMAQIIRDNGALLREICAVDPYITPYAASLFWSGVAAGIGVTLKWKAKEKPPTKAGGLKSASVPK